MVSAARGTEGGAAVPRQARGAYGVEDGRRGACHSGSRPLVHCCRFLKDCRKLRRDGKRTRLKEERREKEKGDFNFG